MSRVQRSSIDSLRYLSGTSDAATVFVVASHGTGSEPLVDSLRTADGVIAATLVSGRESEQGSVRVLARSLEHARFVFFAKAADERAPAELVELASERWCRVDRPRLLAEPGEELRRVCAFLGIEYDQSLLGPIEVAARAGRPDSLDGSAFASSSTSSFAEVVQASGGSLLISTYQTNRLICVRVRDGAVNTHLREYQRPMGLAVAAGRIALGTRTEVWDLRDMPAAAEKLTEGGPHDACYLPRNRHVTGDIAIHELAFAQGQLWLVATGFSCLATLDADHSFVPRWTPPFITRLAPEDRCHLNGMAVIDDRVAYVTALGVSDERGGWRANKASGGVLIDVGSSEIAIGGLSMPHSPRWYQDRLWLLESGRGTLSVADLDGGQVETVAELPGFTRGLAFVGPIALVGLSQIRESSTFGGLPVTQRLRERQSGVWMVDLRSGEIAGFLRFSDLVQEIFDVALLPGARFPEIAELTGETTMSSYVLP